MTRCTEMQNLDYRDGTGWDRLARQGWLGEVGL